MNKNVERIRIARDLLHAEYGGATNFMTPAVIEVGMANPNLAYEISRGVGFSNETIWGVSFVERLPFGGTNRRTDISGVHFSLEEAKLSVNKEIDKYMEGLLVEEDLLP